MPKKKKAKQMSSGIPFQSKYKPHADYILERRKEGDTWPEIVEALIEKGVEHPTESGLCRFIKRHLVRPYAIGQGQMSPTLTESNHPNKEQNNASQTKAEEKGSEESSDPWDIDPYKHIDVQEKQ